MYSADCGLVDSRTHRLADSHQKYLLPEYFVLCRHTTCMSPRISETHGLTDSEYIRSNQWASLYLELIECPYIHLLIYVRFASGGVKIT